MKQFAGRVAFVTGGGSGIGFGLVQSFLQLGMKVVAVDFNKDYLREKQDALAGRADIHFIHADVGDRDQVRAAADEAIRKFVNTASMAGIVPLPLPGLGAYQTAKFAVRGFTESLRNSLAPHGIGVSCLFPGGTKTRIIEAGAAGEAARAAARHMTASWMDPLELGAQVVEAIRNNAPYILTHCEFRDEVRELYEMLDAAFPRNQEVPPERRAFEDGRRAMVAQLRGMGEKP
jgi:NAD(P)-dependent dehydrogenase (short-subunit alcohol dehydrogenase family)